MDTVAFRYLSRDVLKYIDMLEILQMPACRVLFAGERGVLLSHEGLYLLACEQGDADSFLPALTSGLDQEPDRMVLLHDAALVEPLVSGWGYQSKIVCHHAVYQKSEPIAFSLPAGAEIRRLDLSHLDFVHAHYHTVDDLSYLRERIEEGMFGAFFGGELAGFIGTHDERSIGMLEILPSFRRLGLAFALEAYLVNHLLSLGRTPFCQVEIHNEASLALQRKLGFTLSSADVYWLVRG